MKKYTLVLMVAVVGVVILYPRMQNVVHYTVATTVTNTTTSEVVSSANLTSLQRVNKRCKLCFVYNFNTVIDNPNICDTSPPWAPVVDILILICTQHRRSEYRDVIRKTWLKSSIENTGNIRYVFLLGNTNDVEAQKAINEENTQHGDIIQDDFMDAYKNLTYKILMGFKWAVTRCHNARFVMKTDDDMYVNTGLLLNVVKMYGTQLQDSVGGYCKGRKIPDRNPKSKWYVSNKTYPYKNYPDYCFGFGYITSMHVVKRVFDIHPHVPFFVFEDIYVGSCIQKLHVNTTSLNGFHLFGKKLKKHELKHAVVIHGLTLQQIRNLWKMYKNTLLYDWRCLSIILL